MPEPKKTIFVVTNTAPRMISIAKQDILPGKTSDPIPEDMVEAVKKSPPFRAGLLKEGVHEMPKPAVIPLDKLTVAQAQKLISTETNLSVLKEWLDSEKRPEVMTAISERVKAL